MTESEVARLDPVVARLMTAAASYLMMAEEISIGPGARARAEEVAVMLSGALLDLGRARALPLPPEVGLMADAAALLVRDALGRLVVGDHRDAAEHAGAAVAAVHSVLLERRHA